MNLAGLACTAPSQQKSSPVKKLEEGSSHDLYTAKTSKIYF